MQGEINGDRGSLIEDARYGDCSHVRLGDPFGDR